MRSLARLTATGAALPVAEVDSAPSVRAAAQVVVDHLAERGLMPSVYVEIDGRLRCQAVRGYWQIFDGMPPSAGVIGHTYRTGAEHVIPDVRRDAAYLPAVSEVRAEACVPLRVGSRVLGVLNVESVSVLAPADLEAVRGCAGLLAGHLAVGRPDPPSAAQRLARRAARLAQLTDGEAIVAEAVDAACWVSGLSSALLVLDDAQGEGHVCASAGPFAPVFAELRPDELRAMAGWVENGTSSYTKGDTTSPGFAGHELLRAQGASTLVVLPLEASGRRLGFLALADHEPCDLITEDVELLELLATQVAAGLRVVHAVDELRELAATDPLTGLGHHAAFHAALTDALAAGGRVAVVVGDLDGFKTLNDSRGHAAGDALLRETAAVLAEGLPPDAAAFRVGGDEFALLFADGGAGAARRVAEAVRARAQARTGLTLSLGVAQATPGEAPGELMERADAALYAVKRRGRDGIEVAGPAGAVPPWQARLF